MQKHHQFQSRDVQRSREPAEVTLSAYGLLRLSPTRWRSVLRRLAGPAIRLHGLRNVRTRMWREALCDFDQPCR